MAGALLAPLVTWLPFGPAFTQPALGIDLWGAQVFWAVALAVIAAIVGRDDAWLGSAVFLVGLVLLVRGWAMNPTHSAVFALGALALWAVRQTPREWYGRIRTVLAASGLFQACYLLMQSLLQYDPLWGALTGLPPAPTIQALGTLGTVAAAGSYVAITAPLLPLWALPIAVGAVLETRNLGAIIALGVALGIRYWRWKWLRWAIGGAAAASLVYVAGRKGLGTVWGRWDIWEFAGRDWLATDPLFGHGLGGWQVRVPALQMAHGFAPTREMFREAHSEYVQWAYETGTVGLVILGGWLTAHRTMFLHPLFGASIAALAVVSCSFFPLHVVPLALLGIVLVGLATSHDSHAVLGG